MRSRNSDTDTLGFLFSANYKAVIPSLVSRTPPPRSGTQTKFTKRVISLSKKHTQQDLASPARNRGLAFQAAAFSVFLFVQQKKSGILGVHGVCGSRSMNGVGWLRAGATNSCCENQKKKKRAGGSAGLQRANIKAI